MSETRDDAEQFLGLYSAVHERFYRRVRPTAYRPSLESLAILRHLAAVGPLTIGEAADHFGRSQAATSEIVSRLEQRELIERVPDHRDRRRTLVWLSSNGVEVVRKAGNALSERTIAEAFAQMPVTSRAQLLDGMRALIDTKPSEQGWEDDD
ncbi:MAG: MarR family transcriptional regulator [Chloroflexi bacterium]|nr:MarR family transcriptional regulator [Chloroflexota bacterium]MDA1147077.1 MarR family transcriptional regulator [Chloroflexota bacterium]